MPAPIASAPAHMLAADPQAFAAYKPEADVPEAAGPKKRRRVAKVRDPNAPKRPLPAYLVFGNDVKREIRRDREANGQEPLSMTQLNEIVQVKWNELDEKHKKVLEENHARSVIKYNRLRDQYENKQAAQSGDPTRIAAAAAASAAAQSAAPEEPESASSAPSSPAPPSPPPAPPAPTEPEEEEVVAKKPKARKADGEKKRRKKKNHDLPSSP